MRQFPALWEEPQPSCNYSSVVFWFFFLNLELFFQSQVSVLHSLAEGRWFLTPYKHPQTLFCLLFWVSLFIFSEHNLLFPGSCDRGSQREQKMLLAGNSAAFLQRSSRSCQLGKAQALNLNFWGGFSWEQHSCGRISPTGHPGIPNIPNYPHPCLPQKFCCASRTFVKLQVFMENDFFLSPEPFPPSARREVPALHCLQFLPPAIN